MSSQKAGIGTLALKEKVFMKTVVKDWRLFFFPLKRSQWPLGVQMRTKTPGKKGEGKYLYKCVTAFYTMGQPFEIWQVSYLQVVYFFSYLRSWGKPLLGCQPPKRLWVQGHGEAFGQHDLRSIDTLQWDGDTIQFLPCYSFCQLIPQCVPQGCGKRWFKIIKK